MSPNHIFHKLVGFQADNFFFDDSASWKFQHWHIFDLHLKAKIQMMDDKMKTANKHVFMFTDLLKKLKMRYN